MVNYFPYMLVAVLAELAPAFGQGTQTPFSITLSAARNVFAAGSEVKIRLRLQNSSGEEIPYERGPGAGVEPHGEIFTDVEVHDAKGELVPQTKYYRLLRGKPDTGTTPTAREEPAKTSAASGPPEPLPRFRGSFTGGMLKPGEFREEDIVLSKLYDLSQPGQYTVSASRRLWHVVADPRSNIIAKSNTLTITITK